MLQTPEIDRGLERKYEQEFPSCCTAYVLVKHIR
jgi:hypothetical protein